MTIEDRLDHVLKFLNEKDRGSFLWYNEEKNPETNMIAYLEVIGIKENFVLQLLFHLAEDKLISLFYPNDESGEDYRHREGWPRQIKITARGKIFITNGGYARQSFNKKVIQAIQIIGIIGGIFVSLYYLLKLFEDYLIPSLCHC